MPLTMAKCGEESTIRKITGRDEVRSHLAQMGFVEGAKVTVICEIGGNMILGVKGARVALDRSMTNRIIV